MAGEAGKVTGSTARRRGRNGSAAAAGMGRADARPAGRPVAGALLLAVILAVPLGLTVSPARAQFAGGPGATPLFTGGKAKGATPAPAPPSALPGARASKAVAPAAVDAAGMNPTAALFDAINRDDLAAARDALSRGAELQADNVLGMTPLQLSIDLGRNDITFLLLSMGAGKTAGAGAGGPPRGAPVGIAAAGGRGVPARRGAAPATAVARTHPVRAPVVARATTPLPGPDRFAGNGGTPVPSAGFLGFDPSR